MPTVLVYFGTTEGQTKKIAEHAGAHLRTRGLEVEVAQSPAKVDLTRFDAVMIGDSIHIGAFHPPVLEFIRENRTTLESRPSAFFAVCLAIESKREEDRVRAREFIDDMTMRTGWKPLHAAVFAGALKYTQYGFLVRFVMKRISRAEGGPTDTSRDHELTNWGSVTEFADHFADEVLAPAVTEAS